MKFLERFWFGCGHCHGDPDACPAAKAVGEHADQSNPNASGAPMVLSAMAVFLLPLAVASIGAWVVGNVCAERTYASVGLWQTIGAVAGFVVGAVAAKLAVGLVARRISRRDAGVS